MDFQCPVVTVTLGICNIPPQRWIAFLWPRWRTIMFHTNKEFLDQLKNYDLLKEQPLGNDYRMYWLISRCFVENWWSSAPWSLWLIIAIHIFTPIILRSYFESSCKLFLVFTKNISNYKNELQIKISDNAM